MSKTGSSSLDKRLSQFFDSTTELLTDIHARNKAAGKSTTKKKRGRKKAVPLPDPNIDSIDPDMDPIEEEAFGI